MKLGMRSSVVDNTRKKSLNYIDDMDQSFESIQMNCIATIQSLSKMYILSAIENAISRAISWLASGVRIRRVQCSVLKIVSDLLTLHRLLLQSTFMTTGHTHHRTLRRPLSKFFAKSHILQAEPQVHEKAQKLCDKLLARRGRDQLDISGAFSCFATDSSTEYCYGHDPYLLDQDTWELNSMKFFENIEKTTHLQRHVPWVLCGIHFVPRFMLKLFCNSFYSFLGSEEAKIPERLNTILLSLQTPTIQNSSLYLNLISTPHVSRSTAMTRALDESSATTVAGPTSTAIVLSRILHHLLTTPSSALRLHEELISAIPDQKQLPKWLSLEQLPYLSAVIHEGLRLMSDGSVNGLPYETSQNRSPHVATEEDLLYEGGRHSTTDGITSERGKVRYVIPRGFAVSTSAHTMLANESIFPNALEFIPERWIDEPGCRNTALERELWTWGKGSRQCIGMHLAYCQIYLCVAAIGLRVLPWLEMCHAGCVDHDQCLSGKELKGDVKGDGKGLLVRVLER